MFEAEAASALDHPNIATVHEIGESDGEPFIAMAYYEGDTLKQRMESGRMAISAVASIVYQLALGLGAAHAAGIVHRDVTAENILLEHGTDRAIVMDFGIASAMQTAALSDDGRVMGNAHYVSPEQATGEPVDARSDLYSLGVCGFYALTGQLPFDAETPAEVVAKHLTETPPAISTIASAVPARLGQAVDRCLAKEPLRRYRNAESFAEAIDLAFEHAKEIPAPLRVWIRQGERGLPARITLIGISAVPGLLFVLNTMHTWTFFVPIAFATTVSVLPALLRLRRVLREGYQVDDLSAALREHQLLRSEEIAYELSQRSRLAHRIMRVGLVASLGSMTVLGILIARLNAVPVSADTLLGNRLLAALLTSMAVALTAAVGLGGDYIRLKLTARVSSLSISFWGGKWARRIATFAGFGLKPPERPALGMPLLTEVALGRATDHLFQALPRATRRELASLPHTVKQLEQDASALRATIGALDDQLAVFEHNRAHPDANTARDEVERALRAARGQAAQRLAATVAALENIRLDLLRLQMGSAGIESVTASLDAAQRVGDLITHAVEAQAEVERILKVVRQPDHAREVGVDDDDADTPVRGVPATLG